MFKNRSAITANQSVVSTPSPWNILIVDDEPEVHTITRLVLKDIEFSGRRVALTSAYSAQQARELFAQGCKFAVAFVDVVMESDTAGLDLITHLRHVVRDKSIRLILRTGQPGQAPERRVIYDFDINDYLAKTQVTADKLYTTTLAALRSYNDIVTLAQACEQLEHYRDGLESIINASSNLFEQRSLELFASGLLRQLGAVFQSMGGSVLVRNNGMTVVQTPRGFDVLAGTGMYEKTHSSLLSPDLIKKLQACVDAKTSTFDNNLFIGYFPTKTGIVNLLYMEGTIDPTLVDMKLLEIFSKNISIAFENLYLDRELLETQTEIITKMGEVVETRSKESGNHVKRIAILAGLLAGEIGLSEEECQLISQASPMHDLGKVAIPDCILLKPGPLEPHEWEQMKRHAQIGEQVFSKSPRALLCAAANIAGQHHEKWDGSGYPRGLAGENIHLYARVVSIVDVFDALIHKRTYKEPWHPDKVRELMLSERGKHFDPILLDRFIGMFDRALEITRLHPNTDN